MHSLRGLGQVGPANRRTKKLTEDGSSEELSTVMIYSLGITIGLSVSDIDMMIAGEIIDLAYQRANQNEKQSSADNIRKATQADYDNF